MQFMVTVLLAALAMGSASDCSEERAEGCIEKLLSSLLDDTSEEEVCRELKSSIDCLREAVDECLDEPDDEVEDGLKELEKVLGENCGTGEKEDNDDDEDTEMKQCFETNEDYIYECIYEGSTEALTLFVEQDDIDENTLKCTMYSLMSGCFVDRIGEKCGEEAAKVAKEELDDLPEEIKEACEASGSIYQHSIELLEKKK